MSLVGVLALQGGFRAHVEALTRLGADVREVRTPAQLTDIDALVIPGGESTTMAKLLDSSGLRAAIQNRLDANDMPVLGTCAGMIISARTIEDGTEDQWSFDLFDASVRRNGIGTQSASFESELRVQGLKEGFIGVFIRPPVVQAVGENVEVLASWDQRPILCRQGRHLFASFHPELTPDSRIHQLFLERL